MSTPGTLIVRSSEEVTIGHFFVVFFVARSPSSQVLATNNWDWKKKLVAEAEHVFGAGAIEAAHSERETQQLHAKIGQLTMEKDFLSKALGRDR